MSNKNTETMKAFRFNIGTLELTGETRNLGHGIQAEVIYSDGSKGFENIEDFENLLYVDVHGIVTADNGEYVTVIVKECRDGADASMIAQDYLESKEDADEYCYTASTVLMTDNKNVYEVKYNTESL